MSNSTSPLTLDSRQQYYVIRLAEWVGQTPQAILKLIFEKALFHPDADSGFPFTYVTPEDEVRTLLMTWLRESKPVLARVVDPQGCIHVLDGSHAVRLGELWFDEVGMTDYWICARVGTNLTLASEPGGRDEFAAVSVNVNVITVSPVMEGKVADRLAVIDDDEEDVVIKLLYLDGRAGFSSIDDPRLGDGGQPG